MFAKPERDAWHATSLLALVNVDGEGCRKWSCGALAAGGGDLGGRCRSACPEPVDDFDGRGC
jgi:hypothetical protein